MTRLVKQYVLLHPDDCLPPHGLDMEPGGHDAVKVAFLEKCFKENGFDKAKAALIGYPSEGKIQLLSGTHRHEAAKRAGILLPVTIIPSSLVEASWGTLEWNNLIEDIPVNELEHFPVLENVIPPGLDERVNLSELYKKE